MPLCKKSTVNSFSSSEMSLSVGMWLTIAFTLIRFSRLFFNNFWRCFSFLSSGLSLEATCAIGLTGFVLGGFWCSSSLLDEDMSCWSKICWETYPKSLSTRLCGAFGLFGFFGIPVMSLLSLLEAPTLAFFVGDLGALRGAVGGTSILSVLLCLWTYSVGSVVLRSTITFSPFSFSDMYTLWGGCSPPLLPSFELFPREKISLSIPLEVFSPLGTAVEDTGEGWTNSSWTSSTSSTTGGVASRELEPVFTGFDWTDMGDSGGLSRDPGSVLGAGLLFGNTFNEPQLCELSGLCTMWVGLVPRLGCWSLLSSEE